MRLIVKFLLLLSLTTSLTAKAQFPLPFRTPVTSITYDTDAQAFFTALEADAAPVTLSSAQKGYVNTFVLALKSASVWTKMKAIYLMVGGTAASHKYNLKDPRDLDAAFRLAFSGGWTHSSTGALPNGTTGYANTFLIANPSLALGSAAMGYYSRTNNSAASSEMYARDNATQFIEMSIRVASGDNNYSAWNSTSAQGRIVLTGGAAVLSNKLHILSRTSTTQFDSYRDGTLTGTSTGSTIGALPTYSIYIGARNTTGTASTFSVRECAGAFISDGLSSTEVTAVTNAFNAFETSLGRNV